MFQEALNLIHAANRIVIISHKSPDADAIGANLALREPLERIGKHVTSACIDPVAPSCQFLHKADTFVQTFNPADFDLIITVDCGGYKLVGFPISTDESKILNIDHHPSNEHFGTVNIVMPESPATCIMLFLIFTSFNWEITQTMATALLHGIYFDTGSFMHSNTTPEALRIAARLKAHGADHKACVKHQFRSASLEKLKLWGRALSRLDINSKQAVVSAITEEDYTESNASFGDLSGLINYLTHIPEARFSMLLAEDKHGNIKGSLRTQNDDVDLSEIAQLFGGGGHKKAAGFTIPGKLKEKTIWEIV
jgi:bifunctional oligoribonuclease and PAP phosphatase NrnA